VTGLRGPDLVRYLPFEDRADPVGGVRDRVALRH
jgi:hypothetical protein